MSKTRNFVFFSLFAVVFIPSLFFAQEWTQWRGPQRDGALTKFSAPASWPKSLTLKWKTPTGTGFSSPLVSRNRIYLHTRNEERGLEVITCLDLDTGKLVWEQNYPVSFNKNQYAVKMGKGPNSTPILYDGKLYTLGVTAVLSCLDASTGKLLWRKDYSQQIDTSKLFCGTAMSPMIEQGSIVVFVGDDRSGSVISFDVKNGNERWRWDGDGPGYSSPMLFETGGVRQIITLTDKSIIGLSASDGKLLWRMVFPDEWNENIVTPVVFQDLLILSGVRRGTFAVKITMRDDQWSPQEVWSNKSIAMYMNSPVMIDGLLFGLSHLRKGQFFCLDARTGKTLWTTEGREGENAAILRSGDLIFLLTTDASLIVARKNDKQFEPLAKYQVADSATWSHPVILDKQILIKDSSNISLWSF